jgi:hypothetical protein
VAKGNGAPRANSVKLRRIACGTLFILRQFVRKAQITSGAVAKGNLLPFEMCSQTKANRLPFKL